MHILFVVLHQFNKPFYNYETLTDLVIVYLADVFYTLLKDMLYVSRKTSKGTETSIIVSLAVMVNKEVKYSHVLRKLNHRKGAM